MATKSKIEWTESSWNPVTGCTKISSGCMNCYAERLANRLKAMGQQNYKNGFDLTLHDHMLEIPLKMKKPTTFFVNSMSDLFHKDIPIEFLKKVFSIMNQASWHEFQILTKREDILQERQSLLTWTENIWMGVTIENNDYVHRADVLRDCGAAVKFLSLEPLLGPLPNLNIDGLDWIVLGGESGPGARPIDIDWIRPVRDLCIEKKTPFFFKQWGGFNKKKNGALLDGKEWREYPDRPIRKYPDAL